MDKARNKYTRHLGMSLGLAYFFHDYIGLELDAGYHFIAGDRKLLAGPNGIIEVGKDKIEGLERLPHKLICFPVTIFYSCPVIAGQFRSV